MSDAKYSLLPPTSAIEALGVLVRLDDRSFELIKNEILGPSAFDASDDRVSSIASQLGAATDEIYNLLSSLPSLYSLMRRLNAPDDEIEKIVEDFLSQVIDPEDLPENGFDTLTKRLTELLKKNESADRFAKLLRLRDGFLSNAKSFTSFVDLRPEFTEDEMSVRQLIPIVQFRIATDATDPSSREYVFQLDEAALVKLKDAVERAEKKLTALSESADLAALINGKPLDDVQD